MLRVTTIWQGGAGTPYYNQLYFIGSTSGEAVAAATAARNFWGGCANGIGDSLTGQVQTEVEQVDPNTGQVLDVFPTSTAALEGFATGEELPPANQGLIRLLTSVFVAGRRLRGRVYVPAPVEGDASNGAPSGTYVGYLEDAIAALITDGQAAGGPCVYSPTHRIFGEITSGSVWTENFAVMRSRRD